VARLVDDQQPEQDARERQDEMQEKVQGASLSNVQGAEAPSTFLLIGAVLRIRAAAGSLA
jgi:hypothetical protein